MGEPLPRVLIDDPSTCGMHGGLVNHGPKIPLLLNSGPFIDWYLI